jgi:hypothetical protein
LGVRLLILSLWTPKYIIRKELANVSDQTITALQAIVAKYTPREVTATSTKQPASTSIAEQRAIMAQTQAKLVKTLEAELGHEEAVRLGREALFMVGQNIGKQSRSKLGVGDNLKDLTKAAKILYRVLGIEFHLEWLDQFNAKATIKKCALAEHYSELTCEVLCATDEGVIGGLQPNVSMKFKEYMTSGSGECRTDIQLNKKEDDA